MADSSRWGQSGEMCWFGTRRPTNKSLRTRSRADRRFWTSISRRTRLVSANELDRTATIWDIAARKKVQAFYHYGEGVDSSGSTTISSSKPRTAKSGKLMHLPAQLSQSGQFLPATTHTLPFGPCRNMGNPSHTLQRTVSPSGTPRRTHNLASSHAAAKMDQSHSLQMTSLQLFHGDKRSSSKLFLLLKYAPVFFRYLPAPEHLSHTQGTGHLY